MKRKNYDIVRATVVTAALVIGVTLAPSVAHASRCAVS